MCSFQGTKKESGSLLLSHAVASIVPSAVWGLTIVFGMDTGVSPRRIAARNLTVAFGNKITEQLSTCNSLERR